MSKKIFLVNIKLELEAEDEDEVELMLYHDSEYIIRNSDIDIVRKYKDA